MNISPVNNPSTNYLDSVFSATAKSAKTTSTDKAASSFSDMLNASSNGTAANAASGTTQSSQMLSQLISSFTNNGVQNEGSSADPMSIE